jgi:hypothetical protein
VKGEGSGSQTRRSTITKDLKLNNSQPEEVKMDSLTKKDQRDRSKMNIHEDFEVKYWTKELGVSRGELQKAVDKVGNSAAAVRKELGLLGAGH